MAKITITEQVHVDIRIDGETISSDFTPGNVEVSEHIADLLISQGVATIAVDEPAKPAKKTSSDKTTGADTKTTTETPEA